MKTKKEIANGKVARRNKKAVVTDTPVDDVKMAAAGAHGLGRARQE